MSEKQNKALTLEEYLQFRNESRLATILFGIYTILFATGGFYLVSQGGRAYLYTSYLDRNDYLPGIGNESVYSTFP